MTYLMSPYSHADSSVREWRYQEACRAAAEMMREGVLVFSPIAHSHGIAAYGLPGSWEFWREFDLAFLRACDAVVVMTLDGWQESKGIAAELAEAVAMGLPISYRVPSSITPNLFTGEE